MPNVIFPQAIHPERLWAVAGVKTGCGNRLKDKVVLDLGCGKHKTEKHFVGVDMAPLAGIDCTAPLDCLPFSDGYADAIISRHSLEHMLNTTKTIKEWLRVLKTDGVMVIILPDHEVIDSMGESMNKREPLDQHLHAFDRTSLMDFLKLFKEISILNSGSVIEGWSFGVVIRKI